MCPICEDTSPIALQPNMCDDCGRRCERCERTVCARHCRLTGRFDEDGYDGTCVDCVAQDYDAFMDLRHWHNTWQHGADGGHAMHSIA